MLRRLLRKMGRQVWRLVGPWRLPAEALAVLRHDYRGLPQRDVGPERAVREAVAWLARAQDCSLSHDGGVARHYSLVGGWSSSYPETTGYIVPTLLDYARYRGGPEGDEARERARAMLDWLVSIQFPEGGFQGGLVDSTPRIPVAFNTGQVLLGLAAGVSEFGDRYRGPMCRAADWLVAAQDPDGCWRKHSTPFASPGEKTYETHIAWGLFDAARTGASKYHDAALASVRWVLRQQQPSGWFEKCAMDDTGEILTHALGYVLRGILEGYRSTQDAGFLQAARVAADRLAGALGRDGFLPGAFYPEWRPASDWACLAGTAQLASCWLILFRETGAASYLDAGLAANAYVRRTLQTDGPPETRGGIKGSFPVDGGYLPYEYLNWACKFFIDAQLLELRLTAPKIS